MVFDVFYRKNPDQGGYSIFAGLEQILDYIEQMHFTSEDVEYLQKLRNFFGGFFAILDGI